MTNPTIFYNKPLVNNLLANKKTLELTSCPIFDTDSKAIINPERITAVNNMNCLDRYAIEYDFINCMINQLNHTNQLSKRLKESHQHYSLMITTDELSDYINSYLPNQKKDTKRKLLTLQNKEVKLVRQNKRGDKETFVLPFGFSGGAKINEDYKGVVDVKGIEFYFQFPIVVFKAAIEKKFNEGFIKLPKGIIATSRSSQIEYKKQNQSAIIQPENVHRAILFGALKKTYSNSKRIQVSREELIKNILPNLILHKKTLGLKYSYSIILKEIKEILRLVNEKNETQESMIKSIFLGDHKNKGVIWYK